MSNLFDETFKDVEITDNQRKMLRRLVGWWIKKPITLYNIGSRLISLYYTMVREEE